MNRLIYWALIACGAAALELAAGEYLFISGAPILLGTALVVAFAVLIDPREAIYLGFVFSAVVATVSGVGWWRTFLPTLGGIMAMWLMNRFVSSLGDWRATGARVSGGILAIWAGYFILSKSEAISTTWLQEVILLGGLLVTSLIAKQLLSWLSRRYHLFVRNEIG